MNDSNYTPDAWCLLRPVEWNSIHRQVAVHIHAQSTSRIVAYTPVASRESLEMRYTCICGIRPIYPPQPRYNNAHFNLTGNTVFFLICIVCIPLTVHVYVPGRNKSFVLFCSVLVLDEPQSLHCLQCIT